MKEAINRLMAHMKWADVQVLAALRATATTEALRWYAHVLAAERLWYLRLQKKDWTVQKVWPEMTLDECAQLARENATQLTELATRLNEEEFAHAVTYTNTAGQTYTNTVGDILLHVSLHGVHHRGQITASLRAAGTPPPLLDYIRFVRES